MNDKKDVLIVGAGLAGLCCALELQKSDKFKEKDFAVRILESDDQVGGRVKTDTVSGFLLDHGFQVLLTSYQEAQRVLDFDRLNLGKFEPGALIRYDGRLNQFVDPWRKPLSVFSTLFSPLASLSDKFRVARLRQSVLKFDESQLEQPDGGSINQKTTLQYLRDRGFSARIIDRFFRPFFGGVFLESDLSTSSIKFEYLFKMFSTGLASLPAQGMQAIPMQIAESLSPGTIELETQVESLTADGVRLENGEIIEGSHVVLATPANVTAKLLGNRLLPEFHPVACLYFAADQSPLKSKSLVLNGDGAGPINSICVPSDICSTYAPQGKSLVSVSVLGNRMDSPNLVSDCLQQLKSWFGDQVNQWDHLQTYQIHHALPCQTPEEMKPIVKGPQHDDRTFVCGDHMGISSIQGAMVSGRKAAAAILGSL